MSEMDLFMRSPKNPILTIADIPFPCKAVCNPAACLINSETLLLLRVIDMENASHLVVTRSADGVTGWQVQTPPLLSPGTSANWYETLGCEDPRITFLPERNEYVIAYVGYSNFGAGVCLATTRDFRSVERLGMVIHPYNKDAALFPRQINGRYWLLHRPTMGPLENVWLAESEDLLHWGSPRCVLQEDDKPGWDSSKVGTGPPPIETPEGWLLIFHGVELMDKCWIYRAGLTLLDLNDPGKIIARLPHWILEPQEPYEKGGEKPGIIFPTGTTLVDQVLHLYYGAGDTSVALATVPLETLLQTLREAGITPPA